MDYYSMIGFTADLISTEEDAPDRPTLRTSLFLLDFDGTLVDIAETPDGVRVPKDLSRLINDLYERTGGAVAVVSGRKIEDIDRFLPDFRGPVFGCHGAERRVDGRLERHPACDNGALDGILACARSYADATGLLLEEKPAALVLHYRNAPEQWAGAHAFFSAIAANTPGFEVKQAKMALELCVAGISKRDAANEMIDRFPDRTPIVFGDDATDEDMFAVVLDAGGEAVKVGDGATCAPHRLDSPDHVHALLAGWLKQKAPVPCPAD